MNRAARERELKDLSDEELLRRLSDHIRWRAATRADFRQFQKKKVVEIARAAP